MSRWWLALVVLIAVLVRELLMWIGYSWVTGTIVAIVLMGAFFVFSIRRLPKR